MKSGNIVVLSVVYHEISSDSQVLEGFQCGQL